MKPYKNIFLLYATTFILLLVISGTNALNAQTLNARIQACPSCDTEWKTQCYICKTYMSFPTHYAHLCDECLKKTGLISGSHSCGTPYKGWIKICNECAIKNQCASCGVSLGSTNIVNADSRRVVEKYSIKITLPGKKEEFKKYFDAANAALVNNNFAEALNYFNKCNEIIPNGCACQIGFVLRRQGKSEEAIKYFDTAIKEDPTYYEAYYQKGLVLGTMGREIEAEKLLKKAIDLNVPYGDAYLAYAFYQEWIQKDYKQAIEYYEKGFELSPRESNLRKNLINLYEKENRLEDALSETEYSLKLNKNDSELINAKNVYLTKLGKAKRDKKEIENAIAYYKSALEISPQNIEALLGIADMTFDKGNYEEAAGYYLKSFNIEPQNTGIIFQIGNCYARLKQFEKGESFYKQALAINPNLADVTISLADLYFNYGKWEQSIPIYTKLISMDPNNAKVFNYNIGYAQYCINQFKEAKESWVKSIDSDESRNLETYSCLAVCCMKLNDPPESNKYCEKIIGLMKIDNPFVSYNLACAYSLMNKGDKSLPILEKLLKSGQVKIENIESDPDFANVKALQAYKEIKAKYK